MFCALHDQLASLGRHAQLTRCFSAVAELLVMINVILYATVAQVINIVIKTCSGPTVSIDCLSVFCFSCLSTAQPLNLINFPFATFLSFRHTPVFNNEVLFSILCVYVAYGSSRSDADSAIEQSIHPSIRMD